MPFIAGWDRRRARRLSTGYSLTFLNDIGQGQATAFSVNEAALAIGNILVCAGV
jgi:hypothetical protein